jgi:Malectin domain
MNRIIGVIVFFLLTYFPAVAQTQQPIRVNCGGPVYTDSKGQVWQADTGFNDGSVSTVRTNVSGTADPTLYWSNRYNSNAAKPLTYTFAVANGNYQVNLYFAEIVPRLQSTGARVFNIKIEGLSVFQNLDIFAEAGPDAALVKSANILVTNGTLTIEFDNVVQNAKINAIEILPATAASSTTPPPSTMTLNFTYPDGTPVSGKLTYTITSSLLSFQGSAPLTNGQASAALFANPSALGISAQFQIKLNLMDTAGHVLWEINLGMNPAEVNLGSVQNSSLNVVVQKL